jgi:hypothetical protein
VLTYGLCRDDDFFADQLQFKMDVVMSGLFLLAHVAISWSNACSVL